MIDWQYQLQKELQKPRAITYTNLDGSAIVPPSHGDHSMNGDNVVKILKGAWDKNQNEYYEPAEIKVEEGAIVTWVNEDTVVHTVTDKDGAFDSSIMASGQQWEHKFDEGTYNYYCIVHPWMTGVVVAE
jgi:plastocyanin